MIQDLYNELNTTIDLVSQFSKLKKTKKLEELEAEDWKSLEQAYYEHLAWRFRYPKKVFNQQRVIGSIISAVVIILIISGLVFSFWQLNYALKVGDLSSLNTDMSIQTAGRVSINSSIIGAVVLVISLAFFFLYLKNVFKIQYPTPPHVGFEETDLKDKIKSKLFSAEKSDKATPWENYLVEYAIKDLFDKKTNPDISIEKTNKQDENPNKTEDNNESD